MEDIFGVDHAMFCNLYFQCASVMTYSADTVDGGGTIAVEGAKSIHAKSIHAEDVTVCQI